MRDLKIARLRHVARPIWRTRYEPARHPKVVRRRAAHRDEQLSLSEWNQHLNGYDVELFWD